MEGGEKDDRYEKLKEEGKRKLVQNTGGACLHFEKL